MRKNSFLLMLFIFSSTALFSQTAAKSIYFELGTPGIASINYDMRVNKTDNGLGFRVGVGGVSIDGVGAVFVPLGVNYLVGKDTKNYFELGAGATILVTFDEEYTSNFPNPPTYRKVTDTKSSFGHLYFGYRYQPKTSGFVFRAGLAPIFRKGLFVPYIPSISFGYKF